MSLPGRRARRRERALGATRSLPRRSRVSGEALFPAVMGLEAMAQVATALAGTHGAAGVRRRALRAPGRGAGAAGRLRSAWRRWCARREAASTWCSEARRPASRPEPLRGDRAASTGSAEDAGAGAPTALDGRVALDPAEGSLRQDPLPPRPLPAARGLPPPPRRARAWPRSRRAETARGSAASCPRALLLGDPAARDAAMHAVQACVPHATLLPVAVERIDVRAGGIRPRRSSARRSAGTRGTRSCTTSTIATRTVRVVERWTGLTLRVVRGEPRRGPLARSAARTRTSSGASRELRPGRGDLDRRRTAIPRRRGGRGAIAPIALALRRLPRSAVGPTASPRSPDRARVRLRRARRRSHPRGRRSGRAWAATSRRWSPAPVRVAGPARARSLSVSRSSSRREAARGSDAAATRVWTPDECAEEGRRAARRAARARERGGGDGWAVLRVGSALRSRPRSLTARRAAHPLAFAVLVEVAHAGV